MPCSAMLCYAGAIGLLTLVADFLFSLRLSKHVRMLKQKISFSKEAHFRCRCFVGCCANEACLIFNFFLEDTYLF